MGVNHGIIGMNDVDTFRFGKAMVWWPNLTPTEFYLDLMHKIIDNNISIVKTRCQHNQSAVTKFSVVPPQESTQLGTAPFPNNTHNQHS
tara:strand:+ start:316 stop:582 length:267 start_codon:yes stop_codon:yes gene_type:complete